MVDQLSVINYQLSIKINNCSLFIDNCLPFLVSNLVELIILFEDVSIAQDGTLLLKS
jgi:hypothetical protein